MTLLVVVCHYCRRDVATYNFVDGNVACCVCTDRAAHGRPYILLGDSYGRSLQVVLSQELSRDKQSATSR